jgi:hypothetical protein
MRNFLIGNQINSIKKHQAPLSIQRVYKKDTKKERKQKQKPHHGTPMPTKRPSLHYNRMSPLAFLPTRTNYPSIEVRHLSKMGLQLYQTYP